jgi:hypothetical protein
VELTSAEGPCFHKLKKHCFKNEWVLVDHWLISGLVL